MTDSYHCPRCNRLLAKRVNGAINAPRAEIRVRDRLVARVAEGEIACLNCGELVTVDPSDEGSRSSPRAAVLQSRPAGAMSSR